MQTECYQESLGFQSLDRREVVGRFDGGAITSDGGGLLLREVDRRLKLLDRFAACFRDYRTPWAIEFTVRELVARRRARRAASPRPGTGTRSPAERGSRAG